MTRKLDLRTGTPVWRAFRAPKVEARPLIRDVRTDVLVVGMGVSGAMIAEALTAKGLGVVMIDRRGPLLGSTAATTALVQFEIDTPLTHLAGMIGKTKAERAWRRSRLSVFNLKARIAELGIDCRMAPRQSLYLAGNLLGAGALREEGQLRGLAGIRSTYLTPAALKDEFGIERAGALLSHDNLALDPIRLSAGLLDAAVARGARLHAPAEATGFESSRDGVMVATAGGPVVRAGSVVLATGYELATVVPRAPHRVISTWAIATRPQPRALWPRQAMLWEASDPYLYARTTHDGRVICGGEDEDFSDEERRDALTEGKTSAIAGKLTALFPALDATPDYTWTGSFGTTSTGLPYVGRIPRRANMFAVMGYGGNGITYSQIAGEILAAAIGGDRDADADLYAFGR
ncbi:MAG: NAD(P)/FAD-dependent oxidoreductase [Rhizobiaceae bacterium]